MCKVISIANQKVGVGYPSEEIENIIYQLLEGWNSANGVNKQ